MANLVDNLNLLRQHVISNLPDPKDKEIALDNFLKQPSVVTELAALGHTEKYVFDSIVASMRQGFLGEAAAATTSEVDIGNILRMIDASPIPALSAHSDEIGALFIQVRKAIEAISDPTRKKELQKQMLQKMVQKYAKAAVRHQINLEMDEKGLSEFSGSQGDVWKITVNKLIDIANQLEALSFMVEASEVRQMKVDLEASRGIDLSAYCLWLWGNSMLGTHNDKTGLIDRPVPSLHGATELLTMTGSQMEAFFRDPRVIAGIELNGGVHHLTELTPTLISAHRLSSVEMGGEQLPDSILANDGVTVIPIHQTKTGVLFRMFDRWAARSGQLMDPVSSSDLSPRLLSRSTYESLMNYFTRLMDAQGASVERFQVERAFRSWLVMTLHLVLNTDSPNMTDALYKLFRWIFYATKEEFRSYVNPFDLVYYLLVFGSESTGHPLNNFGEGVMKNMLAWLAQKGYVPNGGVAGLFKKSLGATYKEMTVRNDATGQSYNVERVVWPSNKIPTGGIPKAMAAFCNAPIQNRGIHPTTEGEFDPTVDYALPLAYWSVSDGSQHYPFHNWRYNGQILYELIPFSQGGAMIHDYYKNLVSGAAKLFDLLKGGNKDNKFDVIETGKAIQYSAYVLPGGVGEAARNKVPHTIRVLCHDGSYQELLLSSTEVEALMRFYSLIDVALRTITPFVIGTEQPSVKDNKVVAEKATNAVSSILRQYDRYLFPFAGEPDETYLFGTDPDKANEFVLEFINQLVRVVYTFKDRLFDTIASGVKSARKSVQHT